MKVPEKAATFLALVLAIGSTAGTITLASVIRGRRERKQVRYFISYHRPFALFYSPTSIYWGKICILVEIQFPAA